MSPLNILVADEDIDTRIILRTILEREGYKVVEASSAAAAKQAVDLPISLVILNHPIRLSDEMTLAHWLRAERKTQQIPIINLTSRAVPRLLEEAAELGVNATFAKPVDVQGLLQTISELTLREAPQSS